MATLILQSSSLGRELTSVQKVCILLVFPWILFIIHTDKYGNMPLHLVTSNGHTDIAKLLIEKGADISAKGVYSAWLSSHLIYLHTDKNRNTPLHLASLNAHTDVAKLLIEKGADISTTGVYSACLSLHRVHHPHRQGQKHTTASCLIKRPH